MKCYLCNHTSFSNRKGTVRDAPDINILECNSCGLVQLETTAHINDSFYEKSGMHGNNLKSIRDWLTEADHDDQRRFNQLRAAITNKEVLDFGTGAGGFLLKSMPVTKKVVGVELEERVRTYWKGKLDIFPTIAEATHNESGVVGYDYITAFHVFEHLQNPRDTLIELSTALNEKGRIVIEVPNAGDSLLTLFDCDAFQRFTYWSQHLFLFTATTLEILVKQAGLRVISIQQYQRYPLANHLYWLSCNKPGGHQQWSFLCSDELDEAYSNSLARIGKADTLIATVERQHPTLPTSPRHF